MDRLGHLENYAFAEQRDSDEFTIAEDEPLLLNETAAAMNYDANEYLELFAPRDAEEEEATPANSSPAKTTQRKRTYEQRKVQFDAQSTADWYIDEMDTLAKQIQFLEAKLDYLKHRAGIPSEQSIAQQTINNIMLREMLRNQQYLVAGLKSNIARDTSEHVLSPISAAIHLEGDPAQRRATLEAMRYQQLHDGARFMEKRTQFNSSATRFSESTRFQNDHGDTFAVTFDIFPLCQAKSIKQVYDAVLFNWFNLENCMAELFGDVTVREENDTGDESASQHRLVQFNRDGIAIESNSVLFSEYKQQQQQQYQGLEPMEEAIFVSDFVDKDDLYPYRPQERVRKDMTCITTIKVYIATPAFSQHQMHGGGGETSMDAKPVVVLTRWVQSKLHKCEFEIPEGQLVELTEDSNRANAALLNAVCASIRATASP